MPGEKILVVEDDQNLVKILRYNLEKAGYRVAAAGDGDAALDAFREEKPALVILDVMLPKRDGFEVCKALRREAATPILLLTARREEIDRVLGFEFGADDYVTKPFSPRELLGRVKAILRRAAPAPAKGSVLKAGSLEVDWERYEARVKGKAVSLSPKEFAILKCLAEADGRALSRQRLMDEVWGYEKSLDIDPNAIEQHVARLRDKLGAEAGRVVTVKGVGYRFKSV